MLFSGPFYLCNNEIVNNFIEQVNSLSFMLSGKIQKGIQTAFYVRTETDEIWQLRGELLILYI